MIWCHQYVIAVTASVDDFLIIMKGFAS
jgi:hypothetical protein